MTFALPDMRGRTAVGVSPFDFPFGSGVRTGNDTISLSENNLATHSHDLERDNEISAVPLPGGLMFMISGLGLFAGTRRLGIL